MQPNPKRPKPIRDIEWLRHVASLPCIVCGKGPCDAAHIRYGHHSLATKPGDNLTVPLCRDCHNEQHIQGEINFWRKSKGSNHFLMEGLKDYANKAYYDFEWPRDDSRNRY